MTKILAVYLQASGFPSRSSEQLGRYGISLSYISPDFFFLGDYVQTAQTWANVGVVLL